MVTAASRQNPSNRNRSQRSTRARQPPDFRRELVRGPFLDQRGDGFRVFAKSDGRGRRPRRGLAAKQWVKTKFEIQKSIN
jgi:hypothetical protein